MCTSWAHRPHSGFGHPYFSQATGPMGWGEGPMHRGHRGHGPGPSEDEGFGPFGVRRPLRCLAYAAVDERRTLSDFADALAGETFDAAKSTAGADRRVAAAARLKDAVTGALSQIHAVLNPDQRGRLAYLIRTGILAM